ncbi:MAG: hypothetical protein IRY99_08620 [Isosphaeraceae bacterium]|nr:hypothetical protein [Isosphaeraceae bacterium]
MPDRYWLIHPNGGRQLIDPQHFDVETLAVQAQQIGGRLVVERAAPTREPLASTVAPAPLQGFEPPVSALGPLFRSRLDRIYICKVGFSIDMNTRPTIRVLGGYYRKRRLIRVYTHDRVLGRRPLEELFDTFLHEVAHHIEYTEPHSFHAPACGRVRGRMHSRLFWRILGELKGRWAELQRRGWS